MYIKIRESKYRLDQHPPTQPPTHRSGQLTPPAFDRLGLSQNPRGKNTAPLWGDLVHKIIPKKGWADFKKLKFTGLHYKL